MSTQALTASAAVADGTTLVTSATAGELQAFLASDFDEGDVVLFKSTGDAAQITICDANGAALGHVAPQRAAVAVLRADSVWDVFPVQVDPADTVAAVATTAATSSTPFGFAEAQANAIVTAVNACLLACKNAGFIQLEDPA